MINDPGNNPDSKQDQGSCQVDGVIDKKHISKPRDTDQINQQQDDWDLDFILVHMDQPRPLAH